MSRREQGRASEAGGVPVTLGNIEEPPVSEVEGRDFRKEEK